MLSHMHPQLAKFFQYRLAQQELMKELGESGAALSMQQDLRALRGWYKLFGQRVGGPILDMAEVSDLVADTDERPIRLRRYRPDITAMEAPALIYFHGGGWSMGDLDTHDRVCRRLAHTAQAIVIAVDYALAKQLVPAAQGAQILLHGQGGAGFAQFLHEFLLGQPVLKEFGQLGVHVGEHQWVLSARVSSALSAGKSLG